MTDNIFTSFRNMGFNALSNSENEYNEEQYQQNNNPNLSIGDSLVLAATSNKLLSANNGTAITGDLTALATSTGLTSITGVALGDNVTVAIGANPAGATTAPIIYSANNLSYTKSAATITPLANNVYYNRLSKAFYVGCTSQNAVADSAIVYVPPCGQGAAYAAGAGDTNIFATAAGGDVCNAFCATSAGSQALGADPQILVGGNLAGVGGTAVLGLAVANNLGNIYGVIGGLNTPHGAAGTVNAIVCDDGLSDLQNYYILVGGRFTGTGSNLLVTSQTLGTNLTTAAGPPITCTAAFTAIGNTIFPVGPAASSVNAIAFNGSVFLVGGLGNSGASTNVPVVAISTFAGGAFTFAVPTGCNIASLFTNITSLVWNGTYWIAGGTNANGFVLAKSTNGATWSYISGAVTGATSAVVSTNYQVNTDISNIRY